MSFWGTVWDVVLNVIFGVGFLAIVWVIGFFVFLTVKHD